MVIKTKMDFRERLLFAILTVLMAGVGWLIAQNTLILNKHDDRIREVETKVMDHDNILRNIIEAYNGKAKVDECQNDELKSQRDEILELWKSQKRSGNGNGQTTLKP